MIKKGLMELMWQVGRYLVEIGAMQEEDVFVMTGTWWVLPQPH